jgi:hypothetical protein
MSRYLTVPAIRSLIGQDGPSKILVKASQNSGVRGSNPAFDTAPANPVAKAVAEVAESERTIQYWAQKEEVAFSVDEKR